MPSQAPLRLIPSVRSQRASSVVSTVPRGLIPALLTSRSRPSPSRSDGRHHAAPVVGAASHRAARRPPQTPRFRNSAAADCEHQSSLDIGEHNLVRGQGQRTGDPQADPLGRARHQGDRSISLGQCSKLILTSCRAVLVLTDSLAANLPEYLPTMTNATETRPGIAMLPDRCARDDRS